ncbi:cadherin-like domain-containing protein [Pararhizobium sp.]|uniref:cadherin-like domain-containing protein n=1 Tax=Pararhizobium sp. TaxID=1977563 RepID=UPI0027163536|nr:cadherin-like domain-containing protein [Pararhizobium sp.]MDO9417831.1 cadherin-like domain-containing protein [Pararhizobium sp.]
MDDRLILGLPDTAAAIAPMNRFAERERPAPKTRRVLIPAMVLAAVGAFLAKLRAEMEDEKAEQPGHQPVSDGPLPEEERDTAYAPPGLDIAQQVAAYLRQVAEEAATPRNSVPSPGRLRALQSSVPSPDDINPEDPLETDGVRVRRSANDNLSTGSVDFAALRTPGSINAPVSGGSDEDDTEGSNSDTLPGTDTNTPGPGGNNGTGGNTQRNRLPVVAGKVFLANGLMNLSVLLLLDNLAAAATDPDGDPLSVSNLTVSAGMVRPYGPGMWIYTPERGFLGDVTFSYKIGDGTGTVSAKAMLDLLKAPANEIRGTEGGDTLLGTPHEDLIEALGGNDIVYGRESDDIITGGDGDDTLLGGGGNDILYGEAGHDRLFGGDGDDILFGGTGNDQLYGEAGEDILIAGAGDDTASGGTGNDRLFGEDGKDNLSGDGGADLLDGGAGDDLLTGGSGDDAVIAGAGDDRVMTGPSSEERRSGASSLVSDGNDTYEGGEGYDTYDGSASAYDLVIDLAARLASGLDIGLDHIDGFEAAIGGAGDDSMTGDQHANRLMGGDGDDTMAGGGGDDLVEGGQGDDRIVVLVMASGDDGDDRYDGGDGHDSYDASATLSGVMINLDTGVASGIEIGCDQLQNVENMTGGHGDDILVASAAVNVLTGGDGNDIFVFRSVASLHNGGYDSSDRILDFRIGDRIDLSDLAGEIGGLMFDRIVDHIDDQDDVKRIRLYSEFDDGETRIVRAVIDLEDTGDDLELIIYSHQGLTQEDFILAARHYDDDGIAARA